MRTYEKTHPWISFKVDLRNAPAEMWLDLGEASSKCEHLSNAPLRPDTKHQLHQLYLAKGAAATTAIEGNSLSEAEVLEAVQKNLHVPPSKKYQKQEVENIIDACNGIGKQVAERSLPALTHEIIKSYNRQVLAGLPLEEEVVAGTHRSHSVVVGGVYKGAPAEDCSYLVDRLCEWLGGPEWLATEGKETVYAIMKAVIAHLYLAWIHPFGDGNGRTARLLEFHILLEAGVPSPAAHLLSNHYNQTRAEYYRQLDRASKSGGDILPFLRYAIRGFVDGLRQQLEYVWIQQWDIVWQNYVHEVFRGKTSPSNERRRHLALDLGSRADWIKIPAIGELTPRLAKAYAGKTTKTLNRDINALVGMGLVDRKNGNVRARREIVSAFLPLRKPPE